MKTQNRVPNHLISKLFRERVPFNNYNGTIVAENVNGLYSVWHWRTHLVTYDTSSDRLLAMNTTYYSQTTSALQGKILRDLVSPKQAQALYDEALAQGDKNLARRIKRLAGQ